MKSKLKAWITESLMQNDNIRVNLFKNSRGPFLAMLDEARIHYEQRPIPANRIYAHADVIEIMKAIGDAAFLPAIAYVIGMWIKSRSSRKVMLQTKDQIVIQIEGYSPKEIEKLLSQSESLSVIDSKPPDTDE